MMFADFENAQSQLAAYRAVNDFVRKVLARLRSQGASRFTSSPA